MMSFPRKLRLVTTALAVTSIASALAAVPAKAATADCNSVSACIFADNSGSGYAIEGISAGNTGILGGTNFNSTSQTNAKAGVVGVDNSKNMKPYNSGVAGTSTYGTGTYGRSASYYGVYGVSSGYVGVDGDGPDEGVYGRAEGASGVGAAGVFGYDASASSGSGLLGFSPNGAGEEGENFQTGPYLQVGDLGMTFSHTITTYFPAKPPGGLFNSDIGEGVDAQTNAAGAEALTAANFGGGPIMRGYAGPTEVLEVDNAGDMILAGTLTQNGNPQAIAHLASGNALMYAPTEASATVEDLGESRLSSGHAYVSIDSRFAQTMDRSHPYMVFLTPQGDSSGLYVSSKTRSGFSVSEHGGRSNVTFDYRIVAQRSGEPGTRFAAAPQLRARGFIGHVVQRKADVLRSHGVMVQ